MPSVSIPTSEGLVVLEYLMVESTVAMFGRTFAGIACIIDGEPCVDMDRVLTAIVPVVGQERADWFLGRVSK